MLQTIHAARSNSRSVIGDRDLTLLLLAVLVGGLAAFMVGILHEALHRLHHLLFALPEDRTLSQGYFVPWWQVAAVLVTGGVILGGISALLLRRRTRHIVDPIEANALYGGRMSLTDSVQIALLTFGSEMVGASVGMEAAFTQLCSGIASKFGRLTRLKREDLRILVGCGSAAAIAAAFDAPLAGTLYAFELIIGSYTLPTLAPIAIAAGTSTLLTRLVFAPLPLIPILPPAVLSGADYGLFVLVGLLSAVVAIVVMKGVTQVERSFRTMLIPVFLRPACGGAIVAAIALLFPQVLGSGQGAFLPTGTLEITLLAGLLVAKAAASALSIGAGFRGGMFSSALMLGGLFGTLVAVSAMHLAPGFSVNVPAVGIVGMAALAAGIVGAPLTMILLVLESSRDLTLTAGVILSVAISSALMRRWFGYSFATWRFHLRGLRLNSAHDIGWIDDLTVEKLMRKDGHCVPPSCPIADIRRQFPPGTIRWVFVINGGRYLGFIDMNDVHKPSADSENITVAAQLLNTRPAFLFPGQNIRTVLAQFIEQNCDVLPVISNEHDRRFLGHISEAEALRRYNLALEEQRQTEIGGPRSTHAPDSPA